MTFIGGGPKCYGYVLDNGKASMKVKGFSMNYENNKALNLPNMLSVISCGLGIKNSDLIENGKNELLELLRTNEEKLIAKRIEKSGKVVIVENSKITRDKQQKKITSEYLEKIFSFTYTKRNIIGIVDNAIETRPFGY